jgi:hypothetical protein
MYKKVLLFVLILPAAQISFVEFQHIVFKNHSDVLTGGLTILAITLVLFSYLLTIKLSNYKLSYLKLLLTCLIIIAPNFLLIMIYGGIKTGHFSVPDINLKLMANWYAFPVAAAALFSIFFYNRKGK